MNVSNFKNRALRQWDSMAELSRYAMQFFLRIFFEDGRFDEKCRPLLVYARLFLYGERMLHQLYKPTSTGDNCPV